MSENTPTTGGEVVVFVAPDGAIQVDVRLERETVWLTQQQMAELFGRERSVVTKHIRNIFKERELEPKAVRAKFAHTAEDGKTYQVESDGTPRLEDNAMVALALLIAESDPSQKELMIRLTLNLLGDEKE